jgi:hypothetical protein
MTFVNAYMSESDIQKYDIKAIDERFNIAHYRPSWTVDKDENVYLRYVRHGRETESQEVDFLFYWRGELLYVRLHCEGGGQFKGSGWSSYSNLRIGVPERYYLTHGIELPASLQSQQQQILTALKEALTAYKDLGVHSLRTTSDATFDF